MRVATIAFGGYTFEVYDDGSLGCQNVWFEDPYIAALELHLDPETFAWRVMQAIRDWRNERLP